MTGAPLTSAYPPMACSLAAAGTGGGRPPSAPVTEGEAMIGKLIKAALIAVVLAAIVQSLPDIKRYLELRDM
jgi:hypothetical protein